MPSDPADSASKTGHPRLWVAGLVLLALVVGGFVLLRDDSTVVPPVDQPPSENAGVDRDAAASSLLFELEVALEEGTRQRAVALAAPGNQDAAESLADIHDNIGALGIEDLAMRYVDENLGPAASAAQQDPRTFVIDVELTWQIEGYDQATSQMEVSMTLAETDDGAAFVSAGGNFGNRAPLWLLDDLAVDQSRRALVMVADPGEAGRFLDLANQAVADVGEVLPRWRGKLVVAVPASQEQLNLTLGAKEGAYDAIAAITTTVDGSVDPSAPTHIAVNPAVFGPLSETGRQIVMSHEATHVATDAATATMPLWLLEGFADYVALVGVDLPLSVSAGDFLADVRRTGVPDRLPSGNDFDPANRDLGATYEAAWLACRYLAQEYGERKLVSFYNRVDGGESVGEAFTNVLGMSESEFTRGWQDYLRGLTS